MKSKIPSTAVGILILVAYSMLASVVTNNKWIVMLLDVISGLAVIGIAAIMYPYFKVASKTPALSYLILKILEGALMIISGILFLNNSTQYLRGEIYNSLQLYAFIGSSFVFYYLLSVSKLVPRFISTWGTIAIFVLFVNTVFKLFGVSIEVLEYMLILIITNEIFLALWLIIKGFNIQK